MPYLPLQLGTQAKYKMYPNVSNKMILINDCYCRLVALYTWREERFGLK